MNNAGNMFTSLAIILVLSSLSSLWAQTPNQTPDRQQSVALTPNESTQTFTEKSSAAISTRFQQLDAQEKANLEAKQKAIIDAQAKTSKAEKAKADTESALLARKLSVDLAQSRVKQLQASSPTAEQMATAMDALSRAERERDVAQLAATTQKQRQRLLSTI